MKLNEKKSQFIIEKKNKIFVSTMNASEILMTINIACKTDFV